MPLSRSRDYLSIGEVLHAVRPEFPDISISKIRFLESEGLISPERTHSGYRKFYDSDLVRLRQVLALQRDQFLPLRVIKERLLEDEGVAVGGPAPAPAPGPMGPAERHAASSQDVDDMSDLMMSEAELADASGLSKEQLSELQDFTVLERRGDGAYDGSNLVAAKAAAGLIGFGLEPRHLRMFKQAADREAVLFQQIVTPVAKRRDPEARREASHVTSRLLDLSLRLHGALLRSAMRETL